MAIGGGVYLDDEQGEENVRTKALHTNEAAAILALVSTEAVKRVAKGWDVETVSDQDLFSVDGNNCGARAQDGCKGVVTHSDAAPGDRSI